MKAIRHGEAVLSPVTSMGGDKTEQHTKFIVAHSETGHHHILESTTPFTVSQDKLGEMWIKFEAEARLIHQKSHDAHDTLTIEPGIYKVGQKTEYSPFTKQIERVRD